MNAGAILAIVVLIILALVEGLLPTSGVIAKAIRQVMIRGLMMARRQAMPKAIMRGRQRGIVMVRRQAKRLAMMMGTLKVNRMPISRIRQASRPESKPATVKATIRGGMLGGSTAGVMAGG